MWFLLLLLTARTEQLLAKDDHRLILEKGENPCQGYIRVYDGKEWGQVGCLGWTNQTDQVVCRTANCGKRVHGSEETTIGNASKVLLSELVCSGEETQLWDCDHPGWGANPYHKGTRRRVVCSDQIKFGLKGFECAGAVQYSRDNGKTYPGYICRDGFGQTEANQLCKSLGCGEFDKWMNDWIHLEKAGSKMIRINCPSKSDSVSVTNLWQCAPKETSCTDAASVICKGFQRLQLRGNPANVCAGKLEIEENERWKPVKPISDKCQHMNCGTYVSHNDTGSTLTCSDNVKVVLMDNDKPSDCYGEVKIEKNGDRHPVCATKWEMKEALVVCRELNCGMALSIDKQSPRQRGIMDNVECSGTESSLWHCRAKHHNNMQCKNTAYVICSKSAEVRLQDGPGNCAGRVEIKHAGQWKRVENQGWTEANSDTVCRLQPQCGNKHKPDNPEKFSKGSGDFLDRTVNCQQNAKHISACIKGKSNNPSRIKETVGITCEGHKVIVLKGEKACSGMVGVVYGDKTQWLSGSSSWTQETANAVCRQKHCGDADAFPTIPRANATKDVWGVSYNCSPSATSLFDCQEAPLEPDHNDTIASVTCKGNITVSLEKKCWGTVRACVNGKCGGICAEAWTPEKSKLLCETEGCGYPITIKEAANPSPGQSEVKFKSLHATKHTTNLNQCDFIEYDEKDAVTCDKAAYVVCSGSIMARFKSSRDKCSGNVQMHYEGRWLPVCAVALNNPQTQNIICKELNCGQADKKIEYVGPKIERDPVISEINCRNGKSLAECLISPQNDLCTPGGLQCSSWSKMELTKGKGACSGAVHVLSKAGKRAVSLQGWTQAEGNVLCKDLNCGNYKSMKDTFSEATQATSFSCALQGSTNPENIWECENKTLAPSQRQTLLIQCEDDFRFSLTNQCHGELKIKNVQVCATNWMHEYSSKVCNELKCGRAIPGLSSDKKPTSKQKYYHVRCEENHHVLGHCKRSEGECVGELVSVYCAHNVSFNFSAEYCGGQIEINYRDKWEKVCPLNSLSFSLHNELCKTMGCGGHNSSVPENKESKLVALTTTLNWNQGIKDIRYCVEHTSCGRARPAEIYCDRYVPSKVESPKPPESRLVPILLGVGFLLVLMILIVLFIRICIIKKGKKAFNASSRMLSRQEEEFGSGEFENIKENEMQDLSRSRFRSDAEVITENDARSISSYDDIDEAQPLSPQDATPVSENNYINENELDPNTDGVTYEVDDPRENYDDIEAGPEITQTEAEVHHSPQTTSESEAAEPFGLVMGEDDYLVPGQDG